MGYNIFIDILVVCYNISLKLENSVKLPTSIHIWYVCKTGTPASVFIFQLCLLKINGVWVVGSDSNQTFKSTKLKCQYF